MTADTFPFESDVLVLVTSLVAVLGHAGRAEAQGTLSLFVPNTRSSYRASRLCPRGPAARAGVRLPGRFPSLRPRLVFSSSLCIFCGERSEAFTEEGLDLHYWKHCLMLTRCGYCKQVSAARPELGVSEASSLALKATTSPRRVTTVPIPDPTSRCCSLLELIQTEPYKP